jgi:hypothetical protein
MAKSGLTVKVPRTGRVKAPNLDHGALTFIGQHMVNAQKQRWLRGIDANDQPAKRLSKKYLFIKKGIRNVSRPIRDMYLTGMTINNFILRKANDGQIRAENTTREARKRAQRANNIDQMIGFASTDADQVFRSSAAQYGKFVQKAWIPISG